MRKRMILLVLLLAMPFMALADEGMWLVHSFRETIYKEMKKAGFKVGAEQFYNETAPALCDAVVAVDGGMGTGSMISPEGLMITNHHVAYGDIWKLSTPENNYLENGFWATERTDELPVPGKTVTFLRKVVDVTEEARQIKEEIIAETGRWTTMSPRRQFGILEKRHQEKTDLQVSCYSFFRGELYLMMYYEIYEDVRLVGCPPERIGSFGGETDNWGWPQHKGDFAIYRVYGDGQGRPAGYSESNVPLKPEKYLKISTSGVHDGDFAMVVGYPGRTHRFMSSYGIAEKANVSNPIVYTCRRARLDVMRRHMEADPDVRLLYSDQYTGTANYMDYARWESKCVNRYGVPELRASEEKELARWIAAAPARTEEFGGVLDRLSAGYGARSEALRNQLYYRESWFGQCVAMTTASRVNGLVTTYERGRLRKDSLTFDMPEVREKYNNYDRIEGTWEPATDKELMMNGFTMFTRNVERGMWGEVLTGMYDRFGGDIRAMGDWVWENSFCSSPEKYREFFSVPRTIDDICADPMVRLHRSVEYLRFTAAVDEAEKQAGASISSDEPLYQRALYAYRRDKGNLQYPDANSSMRVTYGHVGPVSPMDAVSYDSRSTVTGYMEKYDPSNHDFRVDDRMRALITAGDWGRWGEKGKLYVNFLTDHDITGGNSGSPVLNARGDLIGLCFDGNRESMAADVYYHPALNKGVNVDIRFVLWVIDKYAGAGALIDEMELVK